MSRTPIVWTLIHVTAHGASTSVHGSTNLAEAMLLELRKDPAVLYMQLEEPNGAISYQYVCNARTPGGLLEVGSHPQ